MAAVGGARRGLSEMEVAASRRKHGANKISRKKSRGFIGRLGENFADPMIRILLVALGINGIFLFGDGNWYETLGIALAVVVAVVISTMSEQGSEEAFKRLQHERVYSRLIRDGELVELESEEVVVGDVVSLQPGERIPADGVLISGEIEVDQSALNGETREAKKRAMKTEESEPDDAHSLFGGTVVCSGQGEMVVKAVGDATFFGRLAVEIQEAKGSSPLKERLGGLARAISRIGYIGAILVALAYLFNIFVIDNGFNTVRIIQALSNPAYVFEKLLHAAMLAVTVIVVAVPEGLPMMITVVLSANMKKMLRDKVLVRKLVGVETAGSMNILFTDKTGTLTRGRLEVTGFIDGTGRLWKKGDKVQEQGLWRYIYRSLRYNNMSEQTGRGGVAGGNPTDRALLEYVMRHPDKGRYTKGVVKAFDSREKYMATELRGEARVTLIKGAPELLLPLCTEYVSASGSVEPIRERFRIERAMRAAQDEAARLIAVVETDRGIAGGFERLRLIGVAAVRDEVRREAVEGLRQIRRAGIQAVMITGDSKGTAEAIARRTGILQGCGMEHVLESRELEVLDDEHVAEMLPYIRVIARALPQDKSRLVRIAQGQGLVVGMTGDGVNDAPALRRSDVGFAMGSGTEVAKEAGDIVIMDDNLLSIAKAVRYGRTIFKSIRKFIIFQLTLNFCAMGVSIIAPMLGVETPITVLQMLWINMVMDTLAGLAFGGEQALLEYMNEPPKLRREAIINGYMWREIILGGLYGVVLCLWFLKSETASAVFLRHSELRYLTAFFALFMFTGIFSSFCARTQHVNLLDHIAGNKAFIVIMGLVWLTQIVLIYFGGGLFRTNGLTLRELIYVTILSSTAVAAHLVRKVWYEWRGLETGV